MNRLTLPGTPASWLVTNSESPIAAMRVSGGAGLAVSPAAAGAGAGSAALTGTATVAPIVTGPRMSPVDSSGGASALGSNLARSVSAQLLAPVCTNGRAALPSRPSPSGWMARTSENTVSSPKRSVIGCAG